MAGETNVIITATDRTQQAFASVNASLNSMQRSFRGLTSVLGAGLFINQINKSIEFADSLKEMSKSAGLSTRAFQELRFAQTQSGGTQEGFNQGILKFTQIIGDAANGSMEAQKALARVGITLDDLKSKNVEQLFTKASDTLSRFGSEASRNSAIQDVFGKAALQTANAFAIQSGELDKLRGAAQQAGAVLDEVTIQNAKKAKDQMEALSNVISVHLTQAFVQVGPLLVMATKFLSELADMAGWAARRLGLLQNVTQEQQYQALLEKRLDLSEKIFAMESGPLPWFADPSILTKSRAELEAVDKSLKKMNEGFRAQPKDTGAAAAPAVTGIKQPDIQSKLDALNKSLQTENERILTDFNDKEALLRNALGRKLIAEEEYEAKVLALKENATQKFEDVEKRRIATSNTYRKIDMDSAKFFFGALSSLMQGTSKSQFEIGKKAAIAETIINTHAAAMGAYKALAAIAFVGPALGAAAALAITAAGAGRVAAIKAQQWGGTGGVGGTGSGATPTFPGNPSTGQPLGLPSETGQQRTVTINITGNVMTDQFVIEQVIPAIRDATDNADVILFGGTSRQAREVAA
jgi:hypothetical protein